MSQKLASLRRDLEHIRRHRTQILEQRDRLAKRLIELNKGLREKKISYELYEDKFKYLLGGKTVEEKKKYFKKRLDAIKHREKDLISRIKHENQSSKSRAKAITVLAAMLVVFLPIMTFTTIELTGFASSVSSTTASAVVAEYYAVSLATSTISFGNLNVGDNDENAALNNLGSSAPGYYLTLSADSNTNVQTCLHGAGDFSGGSETMSLGNMIWDGNQTGSSSSPLLSAAQSMTTSKVRSSTTLAAGNKEYYRFWMDVPGDTAVEDYSTTITFTTSSSDCTA